MKKEKVKLLFKWIGRGFRKETFDFYKPDSLTNALDYCGGLLVVPPEDIELRQISVAVGGPVPLSGKLSLFNRKVAGVSSQRYSVFCNATITEKGGLLLIPVDGDQASIGRCVVVITDTSGETHRFLTPTPVLIGRGKVSRLEL